MPTTDKGIVVPTTNEPLFDPRSPDWTRRRFLGTAGAAGAGVILAGCGGGDGDDSTATSDDPNDGLEPQSGGSLTFGVAAAAASETIDGQTAFGVSDWARSYASSSTACARARSASRRARSASSRVASAACTAARGGLDGGQRALLGLHGALGLAHERVAAVALGQHALRAARAAPGAARG